MASRTPLCCSCLRASRLRGVRVTHEVTRSLHPYSTLRSLSHRSAPQTRPVAAKRPIPTLYNRPYASPASSPNQPNTPHQEEEEEAAFDARTSKPTSSEQELAHETTLTLFKECARQADYMIPQAFEASGEIPKNALGEDIGQGSGVWYDTFGLTPTFNTWAQVTFLHMYLLTARLRYFERERCSLWLQALHDHFFLEAEHRMNLFHKISSRAVRQRYLKEMYNQWRGVLGAYDEGLIKGDAVLAAAVWRNVFRGGQGGGVPGPVGDGGADDKGVTGTPGAGQLSEREVKGEAGAAREKAEGDTRKMDAGELKEAARRTQEREELAFDWRRVACVVAFMRRGLSRLDRAPDSVIMAGKVRFGSPTSEWDAVVEMESAGVKAKFDKADSEALERWNKGEKDPADGT